MTEEPERANIRFSLPMKIRHPGASRALIEQPGDILPIFKLLQQAPHPFEVGRGGLVDEVGLAPHDQHGSMRMILVQAASPEATSSAAAWSSASRRRGFRPAAGHAPQRG